jgi:Ala-tRNA(Pro) deacylase
MAIAMTLKQYLDDHHAKYDVMPHNPTTTMSRTAEACHVPGDRMAKAVILRDEDGYLMAVVPATHHLRLGAVKALLGRAIGLAGEDDAMTRFADCENGAFPPLGAAYGMEAVFDDSLLDGPEVYLEAGDHNHVVHMDGREFGRLTVSCRHGRISAHD